MREAFLAFCHVAAAVAYHHGWRVVGRPRGIFGDREDLGEFTLFFVGGGELSMAAEAGRFWQRRVLADADRAMRRLLGQ